MGQATLTLLCLRTQLLNNNPSTTSVLCAFHISLQGGTLSLYHLESITLEKGDSVSPTFGISVLSPLVGALT